MSAVRRLSSSRRVRYSRFDCTYLTVQFLIMVYENDVDHKLIDYDDEVCVALHY